MNAIEQARATNPEIDRLYIKAGYRLAVGPNGTLNVTVDRDRTAGYSLGAAKMLGIVKVVGAAS